MSANNSQEKKVKRQPRDGVTSLVGHIINNILALMLVLIVATLLTFLIESAGILLDWWDISHVYSQIQKEYAYLKGFGATAIGISAHEIATAYLTYLKDLGIHKISQLSVAVRWFSSILTLLVNSIILVGLKFILVLLTMPAYLFLAFVAFIDGLVHRDLRRFNIKGDSSFIHHHARRMIMPMIWFPASAYLSSPWSLNPLWFFAPCWIIYFVLIFIATKQFKKVL